MPVDDNPPLALDSPEVLRQTGLDPCHPNPFNPRTTITYRIGATGPAWLRIYDVSGRLISTLVDGVVEAGTHEIAWDGRTADGKAAASGNYFLRLEPPGDFCRSVG